ncbi:PspC domain-containing protein [Streptomyces sp. 1331.2]|uniref:PspC domain-containing protein n=1 Tax=Streptomyces sp. 1331.2 TaxID=1938835 RepID=UPI000BD28520|nr:PspC domain-containing protein [Streptomyces sp. 1331.2]SOB83670.1 phage shock protein C (PspC) family protein [Streptomyces sp. 1331.2]
MTEDQRIEEAGPAAPPEPERPPLTRAEHHRVVAGVCGGLGRHLDIDPVVFRVVTVVLCLSGGLGLFLYGLAWLIVPTDDESKGRGGRTELQRVLTGRVDGQSIGAVLLTVIGTGVFFSSMGNGDQMFPLLLLAALVFLAVRYDPERRRGRGRGRRHGGPYDRHFPESGGYAWPRPARGETAAAEHPAQPAAGTAPGASGYLWDPRHPERNPYGAGSATPTPPLGTPVPPVGGPAQPWWQRTDLPEGDPLRKERAKRRPEPAAVRRPRERSALGFFGFLLAIGAASAVWAVQSGHHGNPTVAGATVLATALLVIGLTLLVGAKFGRARRLVVTGLLLSLALAFVGHSPDAMRNAVGERDWTVTTAADLHDRYNLGAGDIKLDLARLDPAGGTLATKVDLGAGEMTVIVPADVTVDLTARVGLGDIDVPGDRSNSTGRHTYLIGPADGQAAKGTLTLELGIGLGNIKVVQQ